MKEVSVAKVQKLMIQPFDEKSTTLFSPMG